MALRLAHRPGQSRASEQSRRSVSSWCSQAYGGAGATARSVDQPPPHRDNRGLGAARGVEFAEDARHAVADRSPRHPQFVGDRFVRATVSDQPQNLAAASGDRTACCTPRRASDVHGAPRVRNLRQTLTDRYHATHMRASSVKSLACHAHTTSGSKQPSAGGRAAGGSSHDVGHIFTCLRESETAHRGKGRSHRGSRSTCRRRAARRRGQPPAR